MRNNGLISTILAGYRRRARLRGQAFTLSRDEFLKLIFSNCYICEAEPANVRRDKRRLNAVTLYNGVDRLDSTIGYVTGNVAACCWKCNRAKGDLTLRELKNHLEKMVHGLKKVV